MLVGEKIKFQFYGMNVMDEWLLNDVLECSVCLERLDSTSKVLPCQHTFCKRCLDEIVSSRKELRCPECRILVEIKVEDLPCNILLIRILEGMKNAVPRPKPPISPSQGDLSAQKPSSPTAQPTIESLSPKQVGDNRINTQSKQVLQSQQPCARALYSFEAKDPGDLSFKKGDIVLLRKKMDHNWYQGELDGKHGFFPANYVQVMTPLPAHIPQCKALYDFKMNDNDEKDCLSFGKGDVITVIRRVDENWAEGKLADRIGIFPLSFVEMNSVARALMKLSTNSQPGPSRIAPPTPSSDSETIPLITSNAGSNCTTQQPTSSSTNTTPSSMSSGSSTSTSPSTPPGSSSAPVPLPRFQTPRQREKRHSLTIGTPHKQANGSHRHSIEIISSPIESSTGVSSSSNYVQTWSGSTTPGSQSSNIVRRHNRRDNENVTNDAGATQQANQIPNTHAVVPTFYVSMYQYKPHKEDELELKKGELYTVSEKCQDGWYKGISLRTGQSGVFPGNYVQIANKHKSAASDKSPSFLDWARSVTSLNPPPKPPRPQSPRVQSQVANHKQGSHSAKKSRVWLSRVHNAPELPPRSLSPMSSSASANLGSASQPMTSPQSPISQSWHGGSKNAAPNSNSLSLSSSSSSSGPRNNDKKEKKEKEKEKVSLMKRLTSKKKSKSPPPTCAYSMDNPVFVDCVSAGSNSPQAVHVRQVSGSCPSEVVFTAPAPAPAPATPSANPGHKKSNSLDGTNVENNPKGVPHPSQPAPLVRERFRCIVPYPPNSEYEIELKVGDVIYVHKKRDDGWYKGTLQRSGKTGLFPASFVETF
uniref:RING-type E3 ubiquitin transferase n=1 Tax=Strigamia maritima TaxID=126957 RepID=T1J1Q5_STRMM